MPHPAVHQRHAQSSNRSELGPFTVQPDLVASISERRGQRVLVRVVKLDLAVVKTVNFRERRDTGSIRYEAKRRPGVESKIVFANGYIKHPKNGVALLPPLNFDFDLCAFHAENVPKAGIYLSDVPTCFCGENIFERLKLLIGGTVVDVKPAFPHAVSHVSIATLHHNHGKAIQLHRAIASLLDVPNTGAFTKTLRRHLLRIARADRLAVAGLAIEAFYFPSHRIIHFHSSFGRFSLRFAIDPYRGKERPELRSASQRRRFFLRRGRDLARRVQLGFAGTSSSQKRARLVIDDMPADAAIEQREMRGPVPSSQSTGCGSPALTLSPEFLSTAHGAINGAAADVADWHVSSFVAPDCDVGNRDISGRVTAGRPGQLSDPKATFG